MKEIFERIYQARAWGGESPSGPGSVKEQAQHLGPLLVSTLESLKIETMLDAPCGDFNWMQHVPLPVKRYIGVDIVGKLIEGNNENYANEQRSFLQANIVEDVLPKADLIFCRDCLMHLSLQQVERALKNFRESGARWLLTTTFPGTQNTDIPSGQWQPINLTLSPFHFPAPLLMLDDCFPQEEWRGHKFLGLWEMER